MSTSVVDLARLHKSLGDETRLRIIHLLAHKGELCVCDVESILSISQSKASRHLTYLKHSGAAIDRRDGTWVYYRLGPGSVLRSAVRQIKQALADDKQAQRDLVRAQKLDRSPDCLPIKIVTEQSTKNTKRRA